MPNKLLASAGIAILVFVVLGVMLFMRNDKARTTDTASHVQATYRYLPLGDSYTIGQSVAETERWPNQLVTRLQADKLSIAIVDNPAVTGYTSQNLIDEELPLVPKLKPNVVTVQIGVNDYVQGIDKATFQKHLDYILTYLRKQLGADGKLVLVTIPDYGKTPTGAQYGAPATSEAGVRQFNAVIEAAGKQYNIPVADIFAISQAVSADASLTASDGLHPSGKQYQQWVDVLYPLFKNL